MLDENICRKCKNGNAPPSQSSCWGCRDNDMFVPIEEMKSESREVNTAVLCENPICKELKEKPELGIIAGYWASIATHWHHEAEKNAAKVVELEKKLEETTAMFNAAISDLSEYKQCQTCKFFRPYDPAFCFADGCKDGEQWKWRGSK